MTLVTLRNEQGTTAVLSTYGARLVELLAQDAAGSWGNIVLGHDTEEEYRENPNSYYGATVGRVAGRLARARFLGSGLDFPVTANEGDTHLHGGPERALDRVEWSVRTSSDGREAAFEHVSEAGVEGYPGALTVTATYRLTETNELELGFRATTTAPTPVNLVNHTYFNLSGDASRSIVDHALHIRANEILATDEKLLPVGGVTAVAGTAYDYRSERRIGDDLSGSSGEPWPGVDCTYVLDAGRAGSAAATLWEPESGRTLEITTTEPTLQVYTGNRIPPSVGRHGANYGPGSGICLEAQRVPDSPALPEWPSIVLQPGDEYRQMTTWRLGTR